MIYDVYSLDYDGCLAHVSYLNKKLKNIIEENLELLEFIKKSPFPKIIIVGSNRQAVRDDFANALADERGSCYPAINKIAMYLNGIMDNFLLADIYNDLPAGKSLKQALKCIAKNDKDYKEIKEKKFNKLYNWIHDDSKLTLLYAQMHKLASEHPEDFFNFNFVDDREDILDNLHNYFSKHPDMIPPNVKLNLKQYKGPIDKESKKDIPWIKEYSSIQGTGTEPDKNYRQTVKNMAAVTIEKMTEQGHDISAVGTTKGITSYAQAKEYKFDIAPINCIKHYEPGMEAKNPPDAPSGKKEKRLAHLKKNHSYKQIESMKEKYRDQNSCDSYVTSTSTSSILKAMNNSPAPISVPTTASEKTTFFAIAKTPKVKPQMAEGLMGRHKINSPAPQNMNSGLPDDSSSDESEESKESYTNDVINALLLELEEHDDMDNKKSTLAIFPN